MKPVIAISRQHGSGGRQIGRLLAERLAIPFYDREIIEQAAAQSGLAPACFSSADQRKPGGPAYTISPGVQFELPLNDKVYLAQRAAVQALAAKGPCVIVGRGACKHLAGQVPLLRVFVYSDIQARIRRCVEEYREPAEQIEKTIRQIDKRRMAYYAFYETKADLWTAHFDLCIDSGRFGIDGATALTFAACAEAVRAPSQKEGDITL